MQAKTGINYPTSPLPFMKYMDMAYRRSVSLSNTVPCNTEP